MKLPRRVGDGSVPDRQATSIVFDDCCHHARGGVSASHAASFMNLLQYPLP